MANARPVRVPDVRATASGVLGTTSTGHISGHGDDVRGSYSQAEFGKGESFLTFPLWRTLMEALIDQEAGMRWRYTPGTQVVMEKDS